MACPWCIERWQVGIVIACILLLGGVIMANKTSKTFRHQREWPTLIKIAREKGLSPEDTVLLLAIRDAEAGPPGYEFGVKAAKNTNLEEQARWAAGSIKANRTRYQQLMQEGRYQGSRRTIGLVDVIKPSENAIIGRIPKMVEDIDFPEFMAYYGSPTGYGWAPIHSPNMPESESKLNKNWAKNVRKLQAKYTRMLKEKGMVLNE